MEFRVDDESTATVLKTFKVFEGDGIMTIPFLTDCLNCQGKCSLSQCTYNLFNCNCEFIDSVWVW